MTPVIDHLISNWGFYMKLTFEQKIQIAKEALENSSIHVARKWEIADWTVYKIKALYLENPMLLKHGKNKKYSFEFKEKIINEIEMGELPVNVIAIKFGITSKQVIRHWYHIYKEKGLEGLRDMKQGRPKKDTTKPTKKKYNFSKLVDLENPTPEQVKAMQQELKRQMCMEEVSKKFEALAQELIRKKNGL